METREELADNLISYLLAYEEMRYKLASENNKFFSVYILNMCRRYFNMPEVVSSVPQN